MSHNRIDLLSALRRVRDLANDEQLLGQQRVSNGYGICDAVDRATPNEPPYKGPLGELFVRWPHYSGNLNYPVPGPAPDVFARDMWCRDRHSLAIAQMYQECYTGGRWARCAEDAYDNLPKWTGEYGAKRFELLDFCIETLEADIAARTQQVLAV